ncbi:MAG: 2-C-methyl-D-erythritol 4-phosphate cytidylyltransferase [Acidobacteria bacterium]|nr:2-C-methyl-D-erythritol 4-phosphate cytidylyltransferase [Acidobacteriota bacterium]
MAVGVIVVAAGRGERLGGAVPKQLLDIGGRTMLQRSVSAFDRHPAIDALTVVLPAELVGRGPALVGQTRRSCSFAAGGPRRQDSVRFGLAALPPDVDVVLVHDAARPFVDAGVIDRVIAGVAATGAAVPGVPARDTVKRVRPGTETVAETLPREELWLVQTPQGFRRGVLERAMREVGDRAVTDEATIAEQLGETVTMVHGDERNVKITTAQDLETARRAARGVPRVGIGYDLHRLAEGRRLVIAGVELSAACGPIAHSDGDVVCHALVDALCGAAGTGDVGRHFPNTDPRWKDAAGLDLLRRAVEIVAEAGWVPASVDVTVILERPKLAPHADEIRVRLAGTLGVPIGAIGLKAKTNEGVDAVGRGEAIAAHAVAVILPGEPS